MTRSERVRVKVTPAERDRWRGAAERRGVDLSSFVRSCVEAELERDPQPAEADPGPLAELLARYGS